MSSSSLPSICVYCASSSAVDEAYIEAARRLGEAIGHRGLTLVFGGGTVGLMGEVARSAHRAGGRVVGVIPKSLNRIEIAYREADELIETTTMRERKEIMESRADGFIALPGGCGTFEEFLEILTLRQLRFHDKPLALVNVEGYYDPLLEQFARGIERRFINSDHRDMFFVSGEPEAALDYILTGSGSTTLE